VQKVGRGVVAPDRVASGSIDRGGDLVAFADSAALDPQ